MRYPNFNNKKTKQKEKFLRADPENQENRQREGVYFIEGHSVGPKVATDRWNIIKLINLSKYYH